MKSNFIELHQNDESVIINTNNICVISCNNEYVDGNTIIELTNGGEIIVDETINQVIKCLE